jgi:transposase
MRRAYTFRMRPTARQHIALAACVEGHRELYNAALQERRDAWRGQFISMLRAKAEDAGRTVIEVDPRHTSDRCEACGYAAAENRVTQAAFACRACGHTAHADEHAARNILRAGLAHHTAQAA